MDIYNKTIRLMLADDDDDECDFFKEIVATISGVSLQCVSDGKELMTVLDHLAQNSALPDVIFLDLHMPLKDGVDCLREIKDNENLQGIPVIVYSGVVQAHLVSKTFELGAAAYLCKSNSLPDLKSKLEEVLEKVLNHSLTERDQFIIS